MRRECDKKSIKVYLTLTISVMKHFLSWNLLQQECTNTYLENAFPICNGILAKRNFVNQKRKWNNAIPRNLNCLLRSPLLQIFVSGNGDKEFNKRYAILWREYFSWSNFDESNPYWTYTRPEDRFLPSSLHSKSRVINNSVVKNIRRADYLR